MYSSESVTDDLPVREFFDARYRALQGEVIPAFEVTCAERGITGPETIRDAALAILAAMDGLHVQ